MKLDDLNRVNELADIRRLLLQMLDRVNDMHAVPKHMTVSGGWFSDCRETVDVTPEAFGHDISGRLGVAVKEAMSLAVQKEIANVGRHLAELGIVID